MILCMCKYANSPIVMVKILVNLGVHVFWYLYGKVYTADPVGRLV
jgi:hypothetical protein